MPSLVLYGHRWRVGGDDLALPSAFGVLVNGAWSVSLVSLLQQLRIPIQCPSGNTVQYLLNSSLGLSVANIAILLAITRVSLKGTILNAYPRRHLSVLMVAKYVGLFGQLVIVAVLTGYSFTHGMRSCGDHLVNTVRESLKKSWVAIVAGVLGEWFLFGSAWKKHKGKKEGDLETSESVASTSLKLWESRTQSIFSLVGASNINSQAMTAVSKLFMDFLQDDTDIVATDVIAMMKLLRKEQQSKVRDIHDSLWTSESSSVSQHNSGLHPQQVKGWMDVKKASHYMKFALGAYGWPYYVIQSPLALWALVKVLYKGRYLPRGLPKHIIADNPLLGNTATIQLVTGLQDEELVHVSFHNELYKTPFYIALDRKHQAVVVAVRGTLSLEDVLTDLTAFESEAIPGTGIEGATAHEGMLRAAEFIKSKLVDEGKLDEAFARLHENLGIQMTKHKNLVITGHSLGAGTAAILAILLKPYYPQLRCFAFSPPGGLLSLQASKHCEDFICSVVFGADIVPRLGINTAFDIKVKILRLLRDCDQPKHAILGGRLIGTLNKLLGQSVCDDDQGQRSWSTDTDAKQEVESYQQSIQRSLEVSKAKRDNHTRLYPPGVVLYIDEQVHKRSFFKTQKNLRYAYVCSDSPLLEEILLDCGLLTQHFPWKVSLVLQALADKEQ